MTTAAEEAREFLIDNEWTEAATGHVWEGDVDLLAALLDSFARARVDEAVRVEREACIEIAENVAGRYAPHADNDTEMAVIYARAASIATQIAQAIRARKGGSA